MEAKDGKYTPLSQRVGDSTSNSAVLLLSLSAPIRRSLSVAAQYDAVLRVSGVVH